MSGKLVGAAAAVAIAPFTLVLGIGLGSASGSASAANASDSCTAASTVGVGMNAGNGEKLDANQAQNAATIYQVSVQLKLPPRAAIIAIAASWQEDRLNNSKKADNADSLGLFQERPSQGWGTPAQVTDPVYASKAFYSRLIKVANWQTIPLTQAAQAVERSGHPTAYAPWETFATQLVNQLINQGGTCPVVSSSALGAAILQNAEKYLGMAYQYGGGDQNGPSVGQNSNGSGQPGFDCSGLVQYAVYQASQHKVLLPRVATDQFHDARWQHIPYSQLQPGDLVFWPGADGTSSNPGHVGIYAGNQRFINAPQTGSLIRFDSMAPGTYRYSSFIAGARITLVGSG